jgi:hypothetical protein
MLPRPKLPVVLYLCRGLVCVVVEESCGVVEKWCCGGGWICVVVRDGDSATYMTYGARM